MSRHIPFQSLRQPERGVTQERMAEILARRGNRNKADPTSSGVGFSGPVASGALPNTLAAAGAGSHLPSSSDSVDGGSPINTPAVGFAPEAGVVAAALEWCKPVRHSDASAMVWDTTRSYRIDILGTKTQASYTCWALEQGIGRLNERLGMVGSPEAARQLCGAHSANAKAVT